MADHDLVDVFTPGTQLSVPLTETHLSLPSDSLDFSGKLLQSKLKMATDLRGIPIGPGAFDEGARA